MLGARLSILIVLTAVCAQLSAAKMSSPPTGGGERQLPATFLGKFLLDRSENFDEYLQTKGVNWLLRKMISFSSVTKVFEKGSSDDLYNMANLSSKKSVNYKDLKLGETFKAEGLDGKQHDITFWFANGILHEKHIRLDNPQDKGEVYEYTIDDKDQLVLKMSNDQITCRRWFKRVPSV